ncbi:MAG TPA: transporter substrate-binding domain-containing protein [bacterium]|nr:transporter substrate-binding domain-containing protein [bacterium]
MKNKFIAAILLLAATWAHADDGLSNAARAWLSEHREIIFVGQAAYPPFEFVDAHSREYTGMTIELIRWIATEYGFTATFKPMAFDAAQRSVLDGSADVLTGMFKSDIRSLHYDFSTEVFSVPASIFTRTDRVDIKDEQDLANKRVAVQRGDYAIEHLTNAGIPVEFAYVDDFKSAVNLVVEGKADALIGDEQIVLYHLYSAKLADQIKKTSAPLYIGHDCMAVAKGNAILLSVLDAGIERARATGTLATIYGKWMGVSLAADKNRSSLARDMLLVAAGALVALLVAFGFLFGERSRLRAARIAMERGMAAMRTENDRLTAANASLRRDIDERSRLEEEKRRLDAETTARRVEELTRCAINAAIEPTSIDQKPQDGCNDSPELE